MKTRGYGSGWGTSDTDAYANRESGECTAVLGTMTSALQAQRALANAALHAKVIKISSSQNANGCMYGVTYTCSQSRNVRTVLANAGIAVKKYLGG